ncbi:MAG: Hint domain-containing protein [Pirellulaceae bacterium]|nr:Hint domain-containing protein [Pirellulaceae bacterium]
MKTGIGAPFGVLAIIHGLDTMYAGATQLVSGDEQQTLTKRLANSAFLAHFKPATLEEKKELEKFGEGIDSLVGIVGGLGGTGALFKGAKQLKQGAGVAKTAAGHKAIDAASDVGSNLKKAALGSKADDVANAGSDVAETIGQTGCFLANTPCLISLPSGNTISSEPGFLDNYAGANVVATREALVNIQDVKLGDRVLTQNPRRDDVEYDPHNESLTDWQKISMEVRHRNGAVVDVELLRSLDWVVRNQFQIGTWISFELTDIEVDGRAFIHGIEDVDDLEVGDGELVTGRFVTRQAYDLRRVTLDDGTQVTVTGSHPFWNPTSHQWQPIEEFVVGDYLASRQGPRKIINVELLPNGATVYNIEVAGEHVYEVGECGVLVHNSNGFNCQRYLELMNKRNAGTLTDAAERAEYVGLLKQLKDENFGAHLKRLLGHGPPDEMVRAHAHHILFKSGLGLGQRQLVAEGMEILIRHGIDPVYGLKNLVWAPNIAGQHAMPALKRVLDALRNADRRGTDAVWEALRKLGEQAAAL